jgi:hypothetical protein
MSPTTIFVERLRRQPSDVGDASSPASRVTWGISPRRAIVDFSPVVMCPLSTRSQRRVSVRRLRDKLGDDPEHPRYIRTERGPGHRFIAPQS